MKIFGLYLTRSKEQPNIMDKLNVIEAELAVCQEIADQAKKAVHRFEMRLTRSTHVDSGTQEDSGERVVAGRPHSRRNSLHNEASATGKLC